MAFSGDQFVYNFGPNSLFDFIMVYKQIIFNQQQVAASKITFFVWHL